MSHIWSVQRLAQHGLVTSVDRNPIPDAPRNLTEVYDSALATDPERIAIVGRSGRLSYGVLEAQVNAACAYLAELGVSGGDRVAASLPNDFHVVVAFIAVQRLGAIWAGINRAYVLSERQYLLADAGVKVFITDPKIAAETAVIDNCLPALSHIITVDAADPAASIWNQGLQSTAVQAVRPYKSIRSAPRPSPTPAELPGFPRA